MRAERHRPAGRGGGGGGGRGDAVPPYSAGGGEPGYIAPDPKDPDIFFAGAQQRHRSSRGSTAAPASCARSNPYPRFFSGETVERRSSSAGSGPIPIIFSPVDPNVLYTSSQHVWKTTNGGQTLGQDQRRPHPPRSEDDAGLGRTDHARHEQPGDLRDGVRARRRARPTSTSSGPAPTTASCSVTRDGGKTWTNVTPKDMPDFGRVSQIDASAFDAGHGLRRGEEAAARRLRALHLPHARLRPDVDEDRHRHSGQRLRARRCARIRRARGLLYAGTQHGVYISYDDGDHWQSLSTEPARHAGVRHLGGGQRPRDRDARPRLLHPRQHRAAAAVRRATVTAPTSYLFKPADAIRGAGAATIPYWLKKPAQKLTLEILDAQGQVVRTFNGAPPAAAAQGRGGCRRALGCWCAGAGGAGRRGAAPATSAGGAPQAAADAGAAVRRPRRWPPGCNRFTLGSASTAGAASFPGMVLWGATTNGPMALPGTYQVRLTVDGKAQTQPLVVKKHPLRNTSPTPTCTRSSTLAMPDPRQGERGEQRDHPDPPDQDAGRRIG